MKSYNLQSSDIFEAKDEKYYNFKPVIDEKSKIRELLENSEQFEQTDTMVLNLIKQWYEQYQNIINDEKSDISTLYKDGYKLIEEVFESRSYEVIDRFKIRGIFASWWVENKFTLKSIKSSGYDYKLLSNSYISTNKSFIEMLDEPSLKIHTKLTEHLKKLKSAKLQSDKAVLQEKIELLKAELFENIEDEKALVVDMLKSDAISITKRYLSEKKQAIIADIEKLWDKYQVSLSEIEKERDEATKEIKEFLTELGFR